MKPHFPQAGPDTKLEAGRLLSPKVLGGALAVTLLLLALTYTWIMWSAPGAPDTSGMLAVVTSVAVPTGTPAPAASPTYDPYAPSPTPTPLPGQIGVGTLVQISGT